MLKIKIYLDTNVYGRPFDDLLVSKTAIEAEAAKILLEEISNKEKLILLGSDILKFEAHKTKDIQKKFWILSFISLCGEWIEQNKRIKILAEEIYFKMKLSSRDSIHLASAVLGKVQYFLSFDDDFLKRSNLIEKEYKIKVVNPVDFIKKL